MNKETQGNQKGHTTQKESMGILGTAHSSKETNMKDLNLRDIVYGAKYEIRTILKRTTKEYHQEVHGDDEELSRTIHRHGYWWKSDLTKRAISILKQAVTQACHLKKLKIVKFTRQELIDYFVSEFPDEVFTDDINNPFIIDAKELDQYLYWAEFHIKNIHKHYAK